jgi:hypothetical protein
MVILTINVLILTHFFDYFKEVDPRIRGNDRGNEIAAPSASLQARNDNNLTLTLSFARRGKRDCHVDEYISSQ